MKNYYSPKGVLELDKVYISSEQLVEDVADGLFHIGQSYEDTAAKTLVCKHCGGKEFNVGSGNYFTGIRCTTCHWEICIHDG